MSGTTINFNDSPPLINSIAYSPSNSGSSSISTSDGELMFYTNGNTLYDKNRNIMSGGDNLLENGIPNSTIIVPVPESCTKYYVISSGLNCANYPNELNVPCSTNLENHPYYGKDEGVKYSIVDMDHNGDGLYDVNSELGFVANSNHRISIPEPTGNRSLSVVRHANGKDYWLIAGDLGTSKFHVYEIKSNGIFPAQSPYYEQNVGGGIRVNIDSPLKFNQQGDKIVGFSYPTSFSGEAHLNVPFLIDFNNSNGRLSNLIILNENPMSGCTNCPYSFIAGFEFSPDGKQLYFTDYNGLYQMQVSPTLGSPQFIADSYFISGDFITFHDISISPENPQRILFSIWSEMQPTTLPVASINNPNVGGSTNIELNALSGFLLEGYFPKFVEGGGVWPKELNCYYEESPCVELDLEPFKPAVPDLFSQEIEDELNDNNIQILDKEYGDIDGDGDIDILYVKGNKLYVLINNAGAGNQPIYTLPGNEISLTFPLIPDHSDTPGMDVIPISYKLFDWNGDGNLDLVLLAGKSAPTFRLLGGVFLFLNDGNGNFPNSPTLLLNAMSFGDGNGHDAQNDFPAEMSQLIEVGDLNNDGLPDLLVSGRNRLWGTAYFENTGTISNPSFTLAAPQQIVSNYNWTNWIKNIAFPIKHNGTVFPLPVPELLSTDCTEKLDLFISESWFYDGAGRVFYHENYGATTYGSLPNFDMNGLNNQFGLNDDPHSNYPNVDFPNSVESPLNCYASVVRFVDYFGNGCPIAIVYNHCSKKFYYYNQNCEALSIEENHINLNQKSILIYPNPTDNYINFVVKNDLKILKIQLFNTTGKLVDNLRFSQNKIDVKNIASGVYFLSFMTNNGMISEKIIIK